jgi:hypothetical protein
MSVTTVHNSVALNPKYAENVSAITNPTMGAGNTHHDNANKTSGG